MENRPQPDSKEREDDHLNLTQSGPRNANEIANINTDSTKQLQQFPQPPLTRLYPIDLSVTLSLSSLLPLFFLSSLFRVFSGDVESDLLAVSCTNRPGRPVDQEVPKLCLHELFVGAGQGLFDL